MEQKYAYQTWGLTVASSFPLYALRRHFPVNDNSSDADVVVHYDSLPDSHDALADPTLAYDDPEGIYEIYRSEGSLYWFHDTIGTMRVSDGEQITVSPNSNVDDAMIRWFVVSLGLRSILLQRGRVILHASAVSIDGNVVAIAGESGVGKSTLAAACYKKGHAVLADDAVPLQLRSDSIVVPPGYPRLSITDATAHSLGLDIVDQTARTWKEIDVSDRAPDDSQRLSGIYFLSAGNEINIRELTPGDAMIAVLKESFSPFNSGEEHTVMEHMTNSRDVASVVPVKTLTRPRSIDALDAVVSHIEGDLT